VIYSQRTFNKILDIITITQSSLDVNTLRENLLPSIKELFRSSSCTFFVADNSGNMGKPVSVGIDKSYLQLYQTYYRKQNPFDPSNKKKYISQPQTSEVIIDTNFFEMSEFTKTEYYNDFLKPQNIHNQMIFFLRPKGKLLGTIGVHRSKKEKMFQSNELKLGTTLAHHLALALNNAQSYTLLKAKQDFYHAISECKSTGVFILNENLSVVYANSKGIEICHKIKKDFSLIYNTPTFFLPSNLHSTAIALKTNQRVKGIFEDTSIGRYLASFQTFNTKLDSSQKNKFLLSIEKIPAVNVIDADRLKDEYALSPREIEIVNYVHKGFKNVEIADGLFISEGTVKNHLKNIFRKVGVENRTSLIHEAISA